MINKIKYPCLLIYISLISIVFINSGCSSDEAPSYPEGTKGPFFGVDVKAEVQNSEIRYEFKTKKLPIPNGGEPLAHIMLEFDSTIFNIQPAVQRVSGNIEKWNVTWRSLKDDAWQLILNGVGTKQFIYPGEAAFIIIDCKLNPNSEENITQKYYVNTPQARTIIGHVMLNKNNF